VITREQVIATARSYIGVRFRLHGRDRNGLDCVGLLYRVGTDLGFNLEDDTDYNRRPQVEKINNMLAKYTRPAPRTPPRNGQVLKLRQHMFPMHLGFLVVENGRLSVINANLHKKAVVEDTYDMWHDLVMEHRDVMGVR